MKKIILSSILSLCFSYTANATIVNYQVNNESINGFTNVFALGFQNNNEAIIKLNSNDSVPILNGTISVDLNNIFNSSQPIYYTIVGITQQTQNVKETVTGGWQGTIFPPNPTTTYTITVPTNFPSVFVEINNSNISQATSISYTPNNIIGSTVDKAIFYLNTLPGNLLVINNSLTINPFPLLNTSGTLISYADNGTNGITSGTGYLATPEPSSILLMISSILLITKLRRKNVNC